MSLTSVSITYQLLEYLRAVSSARWRAVLFPCERTRLLLAGGVPELCNSWAAQSALYREGDPSGPEEKMTVSPHSPTLASLLKKAIFLAKSALSAHANEQPDVRKKTTNIVNQRAVRRVSGRQLDRNLWITLWWQLLPRYVPSRIATGTRKTLQTEQGQQWTGRLKLKSLKRNKIKKRHVVTNGLINGY